MNINILFIICWVGILISVIFSDSKKFLKYEAILGAIMGISFYADKLL